MKWQNAAEIVVQSLTVNHRLGQRESDKVSQLISDQEAVPAFRRLHSIFSKQGWRAGWNKFWQGSDLIGWYGELILTQPIRSVALEIENHAGRTAASCKWLKSLTHPLHSTEDSSTLNLPLSISFTEKSPKRAPITSELPFSGKITLPVPLSLTIPADLSQPGISEVLGSYGLAPSSLTRGRDHVRLLQRLNLDQREKPFVEKWRWTRGCGLAQLSDDGRFQIKPALAWARGLEETLICQGRFSEALIEFLAGVESDHWEAPLPADRADQGLGILLGELQMSGFIERQYDAVRFAVAPGDFPTLALRLWGAEDGQSLQEGLNPHREQRVWQA